MLTFVYDGNKYKVDEKVFTYYKTAKLVVQLQEDPDNPANISKMFELFEAVFCHNDDKYAEKVGGTVDAMGKLLDAAIKAINEHNSTAKN